MGLKEGMKPLLASLVFFAGGLVGFAWRAGVGRVGRGGPVRVAEEIVSAVEDEEGWVLMGKDGGVQPWPADWPEDLNAEFFARRGWHQVNVGTEARPKEGWMAP